MKKDIYSCYETTCPNNKIRFPDGTCQECPAYQVKKNELECTLNIRCKDDEKLLPTG